MGDNEKREALLRAVIGHGQAVRPTARRLGIPVSTAYQWAQAARAERRGTASPRFVELVAPAEPIVVRVGAAQIDVRAGFDGELLGAVVEALAQGRS